MNCPKLLVRPPLTRSQITVGVILIVITVFRLWLWLHTPLLSEMVLSYDDGHFVRQAHDLLSGQWLGANPIQTMIKAPGYAFFLAFVCLTGLSYQFWMGVLVIGATLVFCAAINPLIRHKLALPIIYLLLLFTPELFTASPFMNTYRNFLMIPLTMLILSSYIALWLRRHDDPVHIRWIVPALVALPLFWLTTESSIWILPFVAVATIVCAFIWLRSAHARRILWLVTPLAATVLSVLFVCTMNFAHYGVFAVTLRYEAPFSAVTQDMLKLDSGADDDERDFFADTVRWVTNDDLRRIYDASPTLQTLEPQLNTFLTAWAVPSNGGLRGDLVFWGLIEAYFDQWEDRNVDEASFVEFWGKVHDELTEAYADGRLTTTDGVQLSQTTMPITGKDIGPLLGGIARNLSATVIGQYLSCGAIDIEASAWLSGSIADQKIAQIIIGGPLITFDETTNSFPGLSAFQPFLTLNHGFETVGRWAMAALFPLFIAASIIVIALAIRRRGPAREAVLPLLGIALTMLVLALAVTWFSAWLAETYFFWYAIALYPMYFMMAMIVLGIAVDWVIDKVRFVIFSS